VRSKAPLESPPDGVRGIGRRLIAIVAMFVGPFVGAVLILRASMSSALAVAVVLLALNTIASYR